MKVSVTFDLDDRCLLAINHHYGHKGKATRQRAKILFECTLDALLNELCQELEVDETEAPDLA